MSEDSQPSVPEVIQAQSQSSIRLVYYQQEIAVYPITEEQLDTLTSGQSSIHLGFLTFTLGVFVTLIVTLSTVTPMSDLLFGVYLLGTVVSFIMSLYFGIMAWKDWRETNIRKERIKSRSMRAQPIL